MDNNTAIEMLRAHVEQRWQEYGTVVPHAFLALVGDQWLLIPLPNESDDPDAYVEALRATVTSLKPSAVAFAARGVGGDQHFYVAVEFPDDRIMRSLVWRIIGDALVDYQVMDHEPSDDEDDDMRLFKPAPAPPGPPINSELIKDDPKFHDNEWKSMSRVFARIVMDRRDLTGGG